MDLSTAPSHPHTESVHHVDNPFKRTYVVAVYPRFDGAYYCVQYEDFKARGKNISPEEYSQRKQIITNELQRLVNYRKQYGQSIPKAKFKGYTSFSSSTGSECEYLYITIKK